MDKNGLVSLVTNLDITSSGNTDNNGIFHFATVSQLSPDKQFFYAIYNTVYNFDSTIYDTNMFKPGKSTILKYSLSTGQLMKYWLVSEVFDRIDITNSDMLIVGYSLKLKPSYTIDTITYVKDTSDKSKYDVVLASMNLSSNKYNWQTIIKSNYTLGLLKVINNSPFLTFGMKDTIRINGQLFGNNITGTYYTLFTTLDQNGIVKWAKVFKDLNGSINAIYSFRGNDVWLYITCGTNGGVDATDFRYDGLYYPRTLWGANFFNIDPANGNVILNFPSTFLRDYNYAMGGGYADNRDSTFYTLYQLTNTDSLLINGTYYTKRSKNIYYHDYILTKVKVYPLVRPLKTLIAKPIGPKRALVSWTFDSSYDKGKMSVVVFVKKDITIKQEMNNSDPIFFVANANFAGNGSPYPNDSAAKCVYVGDTNQLVVYGLDPSSTYHISVYVVRDFDYIYSTPLVTSVKTLDPYPSAITNLIFTPTGMSSAKVSWTKPASYIDSNLVTVVMIKADTPIVNIDSPFSANSFYASDKTFGNGTKFLNDTNAFCFYKGDSAAADIGSLQRNRTYYLLAYVVRDVDTVNSSPATGNGQIPIPPLYKIGSVCKTDLTSGNPDSLGVKVRVQGITYGFNQVSSGLKFVLRDSTGGITFTSNSSIAGYSFAEGDSLEAEGIVVSSRGLAEIVLDTLIPFSGGHSLKAPTITSALNEKTENDLISLDSLRFMIEPKGGKWPSADSVIYALTKHQDTIAVRILPAGGLSGKALPSAKLFSLIGLGTQVSSSLNAPFDFNGYQIIPRSLSDIHEWPVIPDTLLPFTLVSPVNNNSITLQGDTGSKLIFQWNHSALTVGTLTRKYTMEIAPTNGLFSPPLFSILSSSAGLDSMNTFSYRQLSDMFVLTPGQSNTFKWRVQAKAGTYVKYSDTFSLTLHRGIFNRTTELLNNENRMIVYPNPTRDILYLQLHKSLTLPADYVVVDVFGKACLSGSLADPISYINTSELTQGIYFLNIGMKATGQRLNIKFMKE